MLSVCLISKSQRKKSAKCESDSRTEGSVQTYSDSDPALDPGRAPKSDYSTASRPDSSHVIDSNVSPILLFDLGPVLDPDPSRFQISDPLTVRLACDLDTATSHGSNVDEGGTNTRFKMKFERYYSNP
ncbi:hypothetical protein EVAR_21851_1 [Eumeta japonica]|uniref:Uncharacterized protein n=1 Tax=Eumeta variegata TaxID=151549 RepID=A0A4C1V929_EUMVA|nr:hypothetical protein EVAR_21851_1 [Eumeta japonica]